MEKIFIDLGAHRGRYCRAVNKLYPEFKIIAFEPNPERIKELKKLKYIELKRCAAWTENTTIPLYIDRKGSGKGTTPMPNKISGKVDYDNPVYVKAIDFSQFIFEHKDSIIVVKMNIEGAEFPIFKKMISDDTVKYINALIYAGHSKKVQFDGRDLEHTVREQIPVIKKNSDAKQNIIDAMESAWT